MMKKILYKVIILLLFSSSLSKGEPISYNKIEITYNAIWFKTPVDPYIEMKASMQTPMQLAVAQSRPFATIFNNGNVPIDSFVLDLSHMQSSRVNGSSLPFTWKNNIATFFLPTPLEPMSSTTFAISTAANSANYSLNQRSFAAPSVIHRAYGRESVIPSQRIDVEYGTVYTLDQQMIVDRIALNSIPNISYKSIGNTMGGIVAIAIPEPPTIILLFVAVIYLLWARLGVASDISVKCVA